MQQQERLTGSYTDIFELRAQTYHEAMTRWPNARAREFEAVVRFADLEPGSIVADIPSGGGYLEAYTGELAARIIAVEPSRQFFVRCNETRRTEKRLCPLERLAIPHGTVDAAISLAGLHHVVDRDAVFRELRRILKPGGVLCIADVRLGSPVDTFLNVFVHRHNSMGHEGWFVDAGFKRSLVRAGFDIERNRVIQYCWDFPDERAMIEFCTLLFGLDRASPATVLRGIEEHIGYTTDASGCHMHWELEFSRCRPAGGQ